MADKIYCVATQHFVGFLADINGKHSRLATEAGITSRTIARIKNMERVNVATARDVHKAACDSQFGYSGTFETGFNKV